MFFRVLSTLNNKITQRISFHACQRCASTGCINPENTELTAEVKHKIEKHWRSRLGPNNFNDETSAKSKYYVLSMFPYPSGNLHMGHVRVYTISDAVARFYRMNGKNVLHPMGWDAFGLPAENAAIQHNVPADRWTQQNIEHMKEQLINLGCSFDWSRELATCQPSYYKWTQWLFLRLHHKGLAYQKEALVNWDPVDKTVLADEQVDDKGCSWRSGAKVEKKLLKQWFIKTTKFASALSDGLDNPALKDWRDIVKLQKHWIGECTGYTFDLAIQYDSEATNDVDRKLKVITVWTETPEDLRYAAFVAVTKDHIVNKFHKGSAHGLLQNAVVLNPFNANQKLPIIVSEDITFPVGCDTYLGVPQRNEQDKCVADRFGIEYEQLEAIGTDRTEVLRQAQADNIGGFLVSSKLKDWLISRQRHWGTPIPIVHCDRCGAVPVHVKDLPVVLPPSSAHTTTECPSCGEPNARRELDTMDTFVDSSWYFLRYLDPHNDQHIFDSNRSATIMPVDLYIGGKEHAVLHLYYARFVCHFLHSIGLVPQPEPFQRLLVQGMVMGQSFRIKGSGKYLRANEVRILNAKKNQAEQLATGEPVVMQWEKMSKSKLNGADPAEVIAEHGIDTVRLIMLGDVAPTSHRNWSTATFPGILNWQKRLWLTLNDFYRLRSEPSDSDVAQTDQFRENDSKLFDARNYFLKEATFNYKHSHQLSVAISKMQGLTNSIRRAPKDVIKYGGQYERALATVIIMIAPMAPHFASELWTHFVAAPNRITAGELQWNADVLQQQWPVVDADYKLDLIFKVNGMDMAVGKYTVAQLELIDHHEAVRLALENKAVREYVGDKKIVNSTYTLYSGCEGVLNIYIEWHEKKTKRVIKQ